MEPKLITTLENFEATYVEKGTYRLMRGEYAYGGTAIMAETMDGEPAFVLSVFLEGQEPADWTTIWVKDWSENDGIAEELERRGIIRFTGVQTYIGYVFAREAVISEDYR